MTTHDDIPWEYLSAQQVVLAEDGLFLLEDSKRHPGTEPTDYSYLVFPFAKMYEGFLKQAFLDKGIISEREYNSDKFRIGKVLSPHLLNRLKTKSAYGQIRDRFNEPLARELWMAWKEGRNLVFHYYPHNIRRLSLQEAEEKIDQILAATRNACEQMRIPQHGRNDVLAQPASGEVS